MEETGVNEHTHLIEVPRQLLHGLLVLACRLLGNLRRLKHRPPLGHQCLSLLHQDPCLLLRSLGLAALLEPSRLCGRLRRGHAGLFQLGLLGLGQQRGLLAVRVVGACVAVGKVTGETFKGAPASQWCSIVTVMI